MGVEENASGSERESPRDWTTVATSLLRRSYAGNKAVGTHMGHLRKVVKVSCYFTHTKSMWEIHLVWVKKALIVREIQRLPPCYLSELKKRCPQRIDDGSNA